VERNIECLPRVPPIITAEGILVSLWPSPSLFRLSLELPSAVVRGPKLSYLGRRGVLPVEEGKGKETVAADPVGLGGPAPPDGMAGGGGDQDGTRCLRGKVT